MVRKVLVLLVVVVVVEAQVPHDPHDLVNRPWPPTSMVQVPGPGQLVKLGSYKVHTGKITLSGFSSGGSFAQQMQISYSSLFYGIGVFSHTYYKCGPGDGVEQTYDTVCTTLLNTPNAQLWDPARTRSEIEQYERQGLIDRTENLRGKKLYVYTGTHNFLFTTDMSLRILNIYEPFIRSPSAIMTRVQAANLTLPSDTFGGSCAADSSTTFFIANCGLNGPHEALSFILGDFIRKPDPLRRVNLQPLETFDQREFFDPVIKPGMDDVGFLYVPQYCRDGINRCYIHFYFHGCTLGREFVSDNHIRRSGYLELAEENGIIMVFPQAGKILPENEIGCWDTYGLTGPLFATQRGVQVSVVRKMIERILKNPNVGTSTSTPQDRQTSLTSAANRPNTPSRNYQQRQPPNYGWTGISSQGSNWGQSSSRWRRAISQTVSGRMMGGSQGDPDPHNRNWMDRDI